MSIFDVLTMLGGLSLFLFGMTLMGQALERRAGGSLKAILGRLTDGKIAGLLTGLAVTAVIQSSSATTVMVVGFVNSGIMTLKQSINVIMGANIGTTVTAWILSLSGIQGSNIFVQLLKPSSFTPVLAVIGVILYMFTKSSRKKDTGMILLGFATLMFGMETMTGAVSGLRDVPSFQRLFILFQNPILGVLAGAILTGIIQSSSASVGILQALAATGQVTFGAAVPIIMGQNIGTCVTALISSVGTNRNARRAALVHLMFNIIGTVVWLSVFVLIKAIFAPAILKESATLSGIAIVHTAFNMGCTVLMLPASDLLEALVKRIVPDAKGADITSELDDRLLNTPPIALEKCRLTTIAMAEDAVGAMKDALHCIDSYGPQLAASVRAREEHSDHYEDVLGTYLVKLSSRQIDERDSAEAAALLKSIGDFERISDHAVNLIDSIEEIREKKISFTDDARRELRTMSAAVDEILDLAFEAFRSRDVDNAHNIEPLEQVIDYLKDSLRTHHIARMQAGHCSILAGFVWSDIITDLERVSDHCSNIGGCVIDIAENNLNLHESLKRAQSEDALYQRTYRAYSAKYALPEPAQAASERR